jgi:heme/copper-type cytochrome/quinol oxidase subunit 2
VDGGAGASAGKRAIGRHLRWRWDTVVVMMVVMVVVVVLVTAAAAVVFEQ